MKARVKQAVTQVSKVGLAVGVIFWMFSKGLLDFATLRSFASPDFIVASMALTFFLIFINNLRWQILLRGQGFQTTVTQTFPLSLIGLFFNYVMPGGVGGDLVKGYYLLRHHRDQRTAAAVSILMDRLIGFFVMIFTAVVALLLNYRLITENIQIRALAVGLGIIFVAFGAFFAVAFSSRIVGSRLFTGALAIIPLGKRIDKIIRSIHAYRRTPGALIAAFAISVVSQSSLIFFVALVASKMGYHEISLSAFFFLVPVGIVAMAIPIAPAGIGVGQAAFLFLFNLYLGFESQLGPTAVTLIQMTQFLWGLLGGYFYLKRKAPEPEEAP